MKIEVFAICYNEERLLPYFLRHYTQFSDVTIYDNYSTDNSEKIIKEWGAKIVKYDSGNQIRDDLYIQIKNNCWKESKADWVIVGDCDEFVYHTNLPKRLESIDGTFIVPRLFNMVSEDFPSGDGQIYDEIKTGVEGGAKMNLFKPSEILDVDFDVGCHYANPTGNVKYNFMSDIITLHYKNVSRQYVYERSRLFASRLSDINKKYKWGYHYNFGMDEINRNFDNDMKRLIKIL